MFNKPTVLIIGAGASQEFGMPVGSTLKANIAKRIMSFHAPLGQALYEQMIKSLGQDRADRLARLGPQLSEVIPRSYSIDEALHLLSHDGDVVLLGKLAISYEILLAERGSHLFNALRGVSTFERCDNSWAGEFLNLAVSETQLSNIEEVFVNVKVVDFNYDRVLPEYLHSALQRSFRLSPDSALKCVTGLKVFHPYGCVGRLAWEGGDGMADFGASDYDLAAIASRIKTYTEERGGSEIAKIGEVIDQARVIIVLGFGFLRQNIELLNTEGTFLVKHAFMTGHGIDDQNHTTIKEQMRYSLKGNDPSRVIMTQDKCGDLWRRLRHSIAAVVS